MTCLLYKDQIFLYSTCQLIIRIIATYFHSNLLHLQSCSFIFIISTCAGNGYSLRVLPGKKCHIPVVTSTVQSIMPNAKLTSTTNEELIYSLPNNTARFPDLLSNLTEKKQFLNINHLGLSLTSMEQVFLM